LLYKFLILLKVLLNYIKGEIVIMKKISLFIVLFMAAILIVFQINYSAEAATVTVLDGYLIDKHCFNVNDSSKDTVECLQMECCAKGGYGVAVKQKNGKYKFYKFNKKGNDISKNLLNETKKIKSVPIVVRGYLGGEGINVISIKEK
jgi:hypothetical protein